MQTVSTKTLLNRNGLVFATLVSAALGLLSWGVSAQSIDDVVLNVYKSETCGCCVGWIEHMDQHGFESVVFHPRDLNGMKEDLGIKREWQSCHTAVTKEGFVFEGHIPAKYIAQFLASPPENALGLAAPGMPMGSPGMEMGGRFMAYDILLMKKDGNSEVYVSIKSADQQ